MSLAFLVKSFLLKAYFYIKPLVTAANMREIFLPEGLIAFAVRPDERDAAEHCRDEVVRTPPTLKMSLFAICRKIINA